MISFDDPLKLLYGAIVVTILALLYQAAERRKTADDLAYSDLAFFTAAVKPSPWVPRILRAGWIVALASLAVGMAGPHLDLPLPVKDGAVFMCIDTSGSMASTDVAPTRAQAAQAAANAFIEEAPAGTRIGLIAFSGAASVVSPLTADKEVARAAVGALPPPNGATAIGDAMRLAAANLPPAGHRVIIVVTDGVNNAGVDPQEIATELGQRHIPVYTIGIGTPNGDIIGGEQATFDPGALEGYADASGGAYASAQNATQLREALARLGKSTTIERRPVAAASGFFAAGALLLAGMLIVGLALGRYP
jgi:Ca-activated chloride channel family protein